MPGRAARWFGTTRENPPIRLSMLWRPVSARPRGPSRSLLRGRSGAAQAVRRAAPKQIAAAEAWRTRLLPADPELEWSPGWDWSIPPSRSICLMPGRRKACCWPPSRGRAGPAAYQGVDGIFHVDTGTTGRHRLDRGDFRPAAPGIRRVQRADGQRKMFAEAVLSPADRPPFPSPRVPEIWWTRSRSATAGAPALTLRAGTGAQFPIANMAADGSGGVRPQRLLPERTGSRRAVGEFALEIDMGGAVLFGRSDAVGVTRLGPPEPAARTSTAAGPGEVW
jgi:hypothetical protein